jgi:glucose/mannose transport system permease protein
LKNSCTDWGFPKLQFDWLVDTDMAIYCVVIAGIWQSAGFAMALFLAGLRGIDDSIIKAAQVDGASLPRIYWRIVLPSLRPVFFSTLMVLSHLAIKSFDLVMALTAGGPGFATDVPATFMYTMSFTRGPDRPGRGQRHHDAGHRGGHGGALPVQRTARQAP